MKYDLAITAYDTKSMLHLQLEFAAGFATESYAKSVADMLQSVIQIMAANPYLNWRAIDYMPAGDLQRIWSWNHDCPISNHALVHELIESQMITSPDTVAVDAWDGSLTYRELQTHSQRLARHLLAGGVQPKTNVPLGFEKSKWTVVAMLAVLQAGCAFVLMDASLPTDRRTHILSVTDATQVLCSALQYPNYSKFEGSILVVNAELFESELHPRSDSEEPFPSVCIDPSWPMYIQYTSGSTGQPKGVVVSHAAQAAAILHQAAALGYGKGIRSYDFTSYAFDISIETHFMTLASGGCLLIPTEAETKDRLTESLISRRADLVELTPPVIRTLKRERLVSLKYLVVGGEAAQQDDFEGWPEGVRLVNTYGPSECTSTSVINPYDSVSKSTNIGVTIGAVSWIVDADNSDRLVPVGVVGELLLEGPIVGLGYHKDEARTTEAFVHDLPWLLRGTPGHVGRSGRLYKTGDLVRYDDDGSIVYLGRKDTQVKIRGQRIELGEVEYQLRQCLPGSPLVAAEVIFPAGENRKAVLAAFVVAENSVEEGSPAANFVMLSQESESMLAERLTTAMIPSVYLAIPELPFTVSGKLDRKRLREMGAGFSTEQLVELSVRSSSERTQPTTDAQRKLQQIWADTLKLDVAIIGTKDSFFRLGGDSIAAMRAVGQARAMGISISVADIFRTPTIDALATAPPIEKEVSYSDVAPFSLLRDASGALDSRRALAKHCGTRASQISDAYPCTPVQQGLLAMTLKSEGDAYVLRTVLHLADNIDVERFQDSWDYLYKNMPILRTRIIQDERFGTLQVVVDDTVTWDAGDNLDQYLKESQSITMSLGGPLTRFALIEDTETSQSSFVLTIHHALYDAASMGQMWYLVSQLYYGEELSQPIDFKVFVKYLVDKDIDADEAYWRGTLADYASEPFPPVKQSVQVNARSTETLRVSLPPTSKSDITTAAYVQAAWALAVSASHGTSDVVFGTTLSGRSAGLLGIGEIAGPTIATIPKRLKVSLDDSVSSFLSRTQRQSIDVMPHEQFGIRRIQSLSDGAHRACEFQTLLVIQPRDGADTSQVSKLGYFKEDAKAEAFATYALNITCYLGDGIVDFESIFDEDVLDRSSMQRLLERFSTILQQLMSTKCQSLREIDTLCEADYGDIWSWNKIVPPPVERRLHDLIHEQLQLRPTAPAICAWDGDFTYNELDALSTKLAGRLFNLGVGQETMIPLYFAKSKWIVVAMLAVLKAGAAFVCLDASQAIQRNDAIVAQIEPAVVLASKQLGQEISRPDLRVLEIAAELFDTPLDPEQQRQDKYFEASDQIDASSAAYVIFTSGSTGIPKGVVIEHRAVSASCTYHGAKIGFSPASRVYQFSSYAFDACIMEIFTTMVYGGCICIPSDHERLNNLESSIAAMQANTAFFTPTVSQSLTPSMLPLLTTVVTGGERVDDYDLLRWTQGRSCLNGYGPTECTVFCVMNMGDAAATGSGSVIGNAVGSVSWVCAPDDHNRLVPVGTVGELLIEGPIIARGYLNNQNATDSVFIEDPKWLVRGGGAQPAGRHGRVYKTGDLVKYEPGGKLTYVGRKDSQVKIRGQRVELGEVEYHIKDCIPEATSVAAEIITPTGENARPLLAAFVAMVGNQAAAEEEGCEQLSALPQPAGLRDALLQRLPAYMIPSLYFAVGRMPLNTSGKIHRKQLRALGSSLSTQSLASENDAIVRSKRAPVTATGKTLQRLWGTVLGVEAAKIGMDDSFFSLGGDSIAAMRIVSLARTTDLSLSVANIFRSPTISMLASNLSRVDSYDVDEIGPFSLLEGTIGLSGIESIASDCNVCLSQIQDAYPCTALQEGLLSLTSMSESEAYVSRSVLVLANGIDTERFCDVWTRLSLALPILRTRLIPTKVFGLLQVVFADPIQWQMSSSMAKYLESDQCAPIGLGTPLARFGLVRDSLSSQISFVLTLHHAVYDGHLFARLLDAANRMYHGELTPIFLPFNLYMKHSINAKSAAADAFWLSYLDGFNSPTFPSLGTVTTPNPTSVEVRTQQLSLAAGAKFTTASLIRAAWALTLADSGGLSDVVFGTTVSGRSASVHGIEEIGGPTIATVPIRVNINRHQTVASFLHGVQQQSIDMMPFEQAGLGRLQSLSVQASQACQFQTWLIIQPIEVETEGAPNTPIVEIRDASAKAGFSTYALNLSCSYTRDSLTTQVDFDEQCISRWQVNLILGRFQSSLEKLTPTHYDELLADFPELPAEELSQLWANNEMVPANSSQHIHTIIKKQALISPNKVAICSWDGEVTYAELDASATKLSHELLSKGIGQGNIVTVCFEKSMLTTIAILAVIKTGAAFVLLDPSHPRARLQDIITQTSASLMLCSRDQFTGVCAGLDVVKVIVGSDILDVSYTSSSDDATAAPMPELSSPLYLVFTSGSTGKPKGAMVSHMAFASAFERQAESLGFTSSQRVFDVSSYAFDVAISAQLMILAAGGCLCVPSESQRKDMLTDSFVAFKATLILTTPTIIRLFEREKMTTLQYLLSIGEPPRNQDFIGWPTTTHVINTYGPAECTPVSCINCDVDVGPNGSPTNIGFGIGTLTWVVDPNDHNRLAPIGTVGELVLEGPLVGLGYINEPQLTAAAFIESPPWLQQGATGIPGRRGVLYKTGDLVRYEKDGKLVYVERKDMQVKIRGQRVELGEVEHSLEQCVPEAQCIASTVISIGGEGRRPILAAFIAFQGGDTKASPEIVAKIMPADDALDEALSALLPPHMVPNVYFSINRIPVGLTGKTDRKKLQEIGESFSAEEIAAKASVSQEAKRMPSTPTELALQQIWGQLLGVDVNTIGVDDSFFRLGGDSIAAMLISSVVRKQLGNVSTADILTRKTIAAIAQGMDTVTDGCSPQNDAQNTLDLSGRFKIQDSDMTRLGINSRDEIEVIYPCSPMQRHMLKAQTRDSRVYRMVHDFEISNSDSFCVLDDARVTRAWQAVVKQHALLRAKLIPADEENRDVAMQVILKDPAVSISFHEQVIYLEQDPGNVSRTQPSYDAHSLQHHLSVYRGGSQQVILRLEINHTIMDGYSVEILFRDFADAFNGRLEPSMSSFGDFIEYVQNCSHNESRTFWAKKLAAMKPCHFPTLPSRSNSQGTTYIEVSGVQDIDIHSFCARNELTLATVVQSAWALVLYNLTGGQDNLCFGTILSSRDAPVNHITAMFGPVMCLVPTHVQLCEGESFLETMTNIQKDYIGKLSHQMYPIMDLYEEIGDAPLPFNSALSIVRSGEAEEPGKSADAITLQRRDGYDPVEVRITNTDLTF